MAGLSADYKMECRMFENDLDVLNRAEIDCVVEISTTNLSGGNMTQRLCRRRRAASRGIAGCGKKGCPAVDVKNEKNEKARTADDKKGGNSGR